MGEIEMDFDSSRERFICAARSKSCGEIIEFDAPRTKLPHEDGSLRRWAAPLARGPEQAHQLDFQISGILLDLSCLLLAPQEPFHAINPSARGNPSEPGVLPPRQVHVRAGKVWMSLAGC
jgi:hypothetical protein